MHWAFTLATVAVVLLMPALARADVIITPDESSTVTNNSCNFNAGTGTQYINTSDIDQCMERGSTSVESPSGSSIVIQSSISSASNTSESLTLTSGNEITQSASIQIGTLDTSSQSDTDLENPGNSFTSVDTTTNEGAVTIDDRTGTGGTLHVTGATAPQVTIQNDGDLDVTGAVNVGFTGSLSLTSLVGAVVEPSVGSPSINAGTLSATAGLQVELAGNSNTVDNAFSATANGGGASFFNGATGNTLNVQAVSATQGVEITNPAGLTLHQPISGQSVLLESSGGFNATGAGAVSTPTFELLSEAATPTTRAVTPSSVGDGSGGAIPYLGVSTLSVSGGHGDTFNVTPSANTTYMVGAAAGILNYDAQGRLVSGSLSPPSGQIDATGVQPVDFSGMASVHIQNPGHKPPGHKTLAPSCTLKAPTNKVSHSGHGKHLTTRFTLRATCNQSAAVTLNGSITELLRPATRHHRAVTRTVFLSALHANLAANVPKSLVLTIPKSVAAELAKGIRESASLTLVASNGNGHDRVTLKLARLAR